MDKRTFFVETLANNLQVLKSKLNWFLVLQDAFKKLRNSEERAEENRIVTDDGFCPKKCICTGNPEISVKCSGLTSKDFTPGMFAGDRFTKM